MHHLLNTAWAYSTETVGEFRSRYTRFGSGFYDHLSAHMPECFHKLRFYRADTFQTEDSFAVFEADHPFAIQLDPDCEVICLWDSDVHAEIGTWSPDPYAEACRFIRQHFMDEKHIKP